jgi:hypothetical protein
MLMGLVMLLVSALLMSALPTLGAADEPFCFVDVNGQIVCQGQTASAGGEAKTCTTIPDDGSGLPECGTRRDNECYPDGVMAGKCESEWHWKGGWWLARFYHFGLSRVDFPAEFISLLPPLPEVDDTAGVLALPGGCFNHPFYNDTMFVGPPNTANNTQDMNSTDGTCTNGILFTYTSVFASSIAQATTICTTLGVPANGVDNYVANGYTTSNTGAAMPGNLYWCIP